MKLICVNRYRSSLGSYESGQDVDVTEEVAGLLLRDSPGSFALPVPPRENPEPEPEVTEPKAVEEEPEPEPEAEPGPAEEPLTEAAMSTETETGLVAPDRRARGGRRRR